MTTTAINDYIGSKVHKVQQVQICNDGVEDIQIGNDGSTMAINGYKFK